MSLLRTPDHIRTEGDSLDPLPLELSRRTSSTTTSPINLTGASVYITIKDSSGTPLTHWNDVDITAFITDLDLALIDVVLTADQVSDLVAGDYTGKVKYEKGGLIRYMPNDFTDPGTVITDFYLLVNPA